MPRTDLTLLHPPTTLRFRELPIFHGPISDVVPSSSIFEIYPIGFLTISEYLHRHGISVRIVNIAMKMLKDRSFDPERFIMGFDSVAFGIDLHWLPHVDGSLDLAEIIKKHHPERPVILGGLTATYYYDEIMRDYPFVDFIVCGDSTEEPLRMLMDAIKSGGGYESIPNLVWRKDRNKIVNEMSYKPENLDYISFDYSHLLKMAIKYRDMTGYMPFKDWLSYPVTAVFQCRGCYHNCGSCAGSLYAFRRLCKRERPAFRSPELLAGDIRDISEFTGAPVMLIGDLLQAGHSYAERFLEIIKRYNIDNEIAIEFFNPPPESFIRKVADSINYYNVEISPESHDQKVREAFGKHYTNEQLEKSIETLLSEGCRRVDMFFMIGLPYQDYSSVMDTVGYCEELLKEYGQSILPMIAPLAPFIDPGSPIFENPERYGYRFFYRTLREHRQAMLMPSWKLALNYETEWMKRDDIVRATYDAASMLLDIKVKYGIIEKGRAEGLKGYIRKAVELIKKLDDSGETEGSIKTEIVRLNSIASICDKHELEWPVRGWRLNPSGIFRLITELFFGNHR
ncbi:MAG: TIGR04190 family B12-binding domain/radical SAM domain protein [Nitrospirota bacterium]